MRDFEIEIGRINGGKTTLRGKCAIWTQSGNRRGHPDSWTPAYSEIDIETIYLVRGNRQRKININKMNASNQNIVTNRICNEY